MTTLALAIYVTLGALAFRNHYLSINHPDGVYYEDYGDGWDTLDKYIGLLILMFPIAFILCFWERPNGYNWRKKS